MASRCVIPVLRRTRSARFIPKATYCKEKKSSAENIKDHEFRVLTLYPEKKIRKPREKISYFQAMPPREKKMPVDQDWPTVWPTASSFRPSVVPLPVYQGYVKKGVPPGKYANAELMKIPNFLHLTPPAIKRQCAAIRKFCSNWPEALDTDEKCDTYFPLEVITATYCHSSPTIRDERSRIITLKVRLDGLNLDYHANDKIRRLVGEKRFDAKKNMLILVADRCPLRKQNYDYLIYVLAALYRESQITEPWECEKTEDDMERFFFEGSRHQNHILETASAVKSANGENKEISIDELKMSEEILEYGNSVTDIINEGEDTCFINKYKECVLQVLGLPSAIKTAQ